MGRMKNFQEEIYGEKIADIYDTWYATIDPRMIHVLTRYAQGGKALELGIGTGRVALPLQKCGIELFGIDASPAMVAKLNAKAGGKTIPVHMGSFTEIPFEENFDVIYVVFNTIFALITQEEQTRCFQAVADHLKPNGVFVVEAFVPDLGRFSGGQTVRAVELENQSVRLDVSMLDIANQVISSQHVSLTEDGIKLVPVKIRYIWPAEMDLIARLAGMRLTKRWSGWDETPFNSSSGKHISVYELS
jgi:SAM-dependent methyltransferase